MLCHHTVVSNTREQRHNLSVNYNGASPAFGVVLKQCRVLQPKQVQEKPFFKNNSVLYQRIWLLLSSPWRTTTSSAVGDDVWKLHYLITDHRNSLLSLQIIFCCFLIILSSSTFYVFLSALFKYFCIGVLGHLSEAGRKTGYERAAVIVSSAAPLLCTQLH